MPRAWKRRLHAEGRPARPVHALRRERPRLRGALDAPPDAHLRLDDARRFHGARGVHVRPRGGQRPARPLGGPEPREGPRAPTGSSRSRSACSASPCPAPARRGRGRLRPPRAAARSVAHALLRRAVSPRRPRARPALRAHGRHVAGARPVARRPRGGDRRPRRGALRRQYARGVCGDGGRDVRPPAERRNQEERARRGGAQSLRRPRRRSASPGARGRPPRISKRTPRPRPPAEAPEHARLLLAAIALSGFAAMVDEVTWARLVGLVFGSSVYAFGLMLLLFLAGIAIGSALFARIRRVEPARVLGLALLGNTFAALAGIAFVPRLPVAFMRGFPAAKDSFALEQALQLLLTAPLLLPLAILFGIAFPAAVAATAHLRATGQRHRPRDCLEHRRYGGRRVPRGLRPDPAARTAGVAHTRGRRDHRRRPARAQAPRRREVASARVDRGRDRPPRRAAAAGLAPRNAGSRRRLLRCDLRLGGGPHRVGKALGAPLL